MSSAAVNEPNDIADLDVISVAETAGPIVQVEATVTHTTCSVCGKYRLITQIVVGGPPKRTCQNVSPFNCFQESSLVPPAIEREVILAKEVIGDWKYPTKFKECTSSNSQKQKMTAAKFQSGTGRGEKYVRSLLQQLGKKPSNSGGNLVLLLHDLAHHDLLKKRSATIPMSQSTFTMENVTTSTTMASFYSVPRSILMAILNAEGAVGNIQQKTGDDERAEQAARILLIRNGDDVPLLPSVAIKKNAKKAKFSLNTLPTAPAALQIAVPSYSSSTSSTSSSTSSSSSSISKKRKSKDKHLERPLKRHADLAVSRSMRSSRGRDGHGTIAYQQLLRHSAEISSVATVFAAEISHEENGKSTIVISEHCTEDELKKALWKLLLGLENKTVKFIKKQDELKRINVIEDGKINRERKQEQPPTTGPMD